MRCIFLRGGALDRWSQEPRPSVWCATSCSPPWNRPNRVLSSSLPSGRTAACCSTPSNACNRSAAPSTRIELAGAELLAQEAPAAGDRHSHRRRARSATASWQPWATPCTCCATWRTSEANRQEIPGAALAGDQRSALCRRAAGAAGKLLQRPPGYPAAAEHCHPTTLPGKPNWAGKPADAPLVPDRPARPDPRTEPYPSLKLMGPRWRASTVCTAGGPFAAVLDRRRGDRVDRRWPTVAAQVSAATVLAHRPRAQTLIGPAYEGRHLLKELLYLVALSDGQGPRSRGPRTAWAGAAAVHRPPAGRGIAAPVRPRPVSGAFAVHGDPRELAGVKYMLDLIRAAARPQPDSLTNLHAQLGRS